MSLVMDKRCFSLVVLISTFFASSIFAQKLIFSYDASGNQIERKWVCVNCITNKDKVAAKRNAEEKNTNIKEDHDLGRVIKVHPNPVSEILNVSWQATEKVFLKSIDVFNISGNRVYHAIYSIGKFEDQIGFNRFPPGTYILIGNYSDSKTQSIKIIKI